MYAYSDKQKQFRAIPSLSHDSGNPVSSPTGHPSHPLSRIQHLAGNQAIARWAGQGKVPGETCESSPIPVDVLSETEDISDGQYIDETGSPAPAAGAAPPVPAAPAGPALPTELYQLLTGWAPGPDKYGFQLKFRCRSTSGDVRDLQNQAPNLIWRERVTYSRNDFSHRITPNNPTILPPGGVSFAPASTRIVGTNLLEFTAATDTHWMPTSAVRSGDFTTAAPPPPGFIGPVLPSLPAIMESRQVYHYSADGGTSWNYLAGAFNIRRTLFDDGGTLKFRTQKVGIHTTTENYKP